MKGSSNNLRKGSEMKKRIGMLFAVAMTAVCAQADTWTDPDTGYTWTYQITGDTADFR